MHDHLREQRVEARVARVADVPRGVGAHAGPGRRLERAERARGRQREAVLRAQLLGVHAQLDRIAARRGHVRLREAELGERAPLGEVELERDEVDAGHRLGDGVLDLEPRVRLDEVERLGRIRVDEELDRAEAGVVRGAREQDRGRVQALAQRGREPGRGRDLDELLVAALEAALALREVHHRAGRVADHLHLDVSRAREPALHVEVAAAERGRGLARAALERLLELRCASARAARRGRRRPRPP